MLGHVGDVSSTPSRRRLNARHATIIYTNEVNMKSRFHSLPFELQLSDVTCPTDCLSVCVWYDNKLLHEVTLLLPNLQRQVKVNLF